MFGFGEDAKTESKNTTQTQTKNGVTQTQLPWWLTDAAQNNLAFAGGIKDGSFGSTMSPWQMQGLDLASKGAAGGGGGDIAKRWFEQYATGSPGSITPSHIDPSQLSKVNAPTLNTTSILGGGFNPATGSIGDYMSPYTQGALDPTLRNIQRSGAIARSGAGGIDSGATSAGAFGDARHGIERSEQQRNQAQLEADTTAQAFDRAFTQGAGLRGQDVSNLLGTDRFNASNNMAGQQFNATQLWQNLMANAGFDMNASTANAGLQEQALQRMLGGGNAMLGLESFNNNKDAGWAQMLYGMGKDAQMYPFLQLQAGNSALAGAQGAAPRTIFESGTMNSTGTSETSKPDNSGWGMVGNIAGNALPWLLSDARAKENIEEVGSLNDGTPVYKYNYKGISTPMIGLMAQEVEKWEPDAVREFNGVKMVDYDKATFLSRVLGSGADHALAA